MKRNISDLLDQYPAEDMELGGNTPYSPTRIKEITMNNIENMDVKTNRAVKRFRPARLLVAAAVAAALSVSALAAGRLWGGELFRDVFEKGGSSALSQGQLETIDRLAQGFEGQDGSIPPAVSDNGATITPIAALADENIYYLRLRVEAPEGTALPDLDMDRDGAVYQLFGPEGADHIDLEPGAYPENASFGYQLEFRALPDSEPNDNIKEFIVQFTNLSDGGITLNDGVSKVLTVHGLWVQNQDKDYTPIFTGKFAFDIGLNFQSQSVNVDAEGSTWSTRAEDEFRNKVYNVTNTVKEMSLSPLSLSYRYTTTLPRLPRDNNWIGASLGPVEIVLKDGTVISTLHGCDTDINASSSGEEQELEGFRVFDQPLDLSQVDYVQYGDSKIPVNAG